MARTPIATENWNRADGDPGADWAQLNLDWGSVTIVSNQFIASAGTQPIGNAPAARWVGAGSFTADQYAKAVFVGPLAFGGTSDLVGVIARASGDTNTARDYYCAFMINNNSGTNPRPLELGKIVDGTYTQLATTSVAWAANDTVEIECEGTTIRSLRNGAVVDSVVDTSLTTGVPGVVACIAGDDWEGGNLVAAGGVYSRIPQDTPGLAAWAVRRM